MKRKLTLAFLAALILTIGTAAVLGALETPRHLLLALNGFSLMVGLVGLDWLRPTTGAVDPTAVQSSQVNTCVVDVTTDGVATTVDLNHNMGLPADQLAFGFPDVSIIPISPTGVPATLLPQVTIPNTANKITLTFAAVAATFRVSIRRPHSVPR